MSVKVKLQLEKGDIESQIKQLFNRMSGPIAKSLKGGGELGISAGPGAGILGALGKLSTPLGMMVIAANQGLELSRKTLDVLSESSGHLRGTMMLMDKSMKLFLRPAANAISQFLRPISKDLLKLSKEWNKFWKTEEGQAGAEVGIETGKFMLNPFEGMRKLVEDLSISFGETVMEWLMGIEWPDIGGILREAWDNIVNSVSEWWNSIEWPELDFSVIIKWFDDNFTLPEIDWSDVENFGADIYNQIITAIGDGIDVLANLGQTVYDWIWDQIRGIVRSAESFIMNIVGGGQFGIENVEQTGLYYLHRGERVESPYNSDTRGEKNISININNPTVRNNADIDTIADEVSRVLRRERLMRTSYALR